MRAGGSSAMKRWSSPGKAKWSRSLRSTSPTTPSASRKTPSREPGSTDTRSSARIISRWHSRTTASPGRGSDSEGPKHVSGRCPADRSFRSARTDSSVKTAVSGRLSGSNPFPVALEGIKFVPASPIRARFSPQEAARRNEFRRVFPLSGRGEGPETQRDGLIQNVRDGRRASFFAPNVPLACR